MKRTFSDPEHFPYVGANLRRLRYMRDKKMKTVATELGISHSTISLIENGRYKSISLHMLQKFADYYKVSIEDMLVH